MALAAMTELITIEATGMRNVIICTEKRGVFSGRLENLNNGKSTLVDARMCVYWDSETRGVLGLASTGPSQGCRITRSVPRIELCGVTAVIDMTAEAVAAWAREPWA